MHYQNTVHTEGSPRHHNLPLAVSGKIRKVVLVVGLVTAFTLAALWTAWFVAGGSESQPSVTGADTLNQTSGETSQSEWQSNLLAWERALDPRNLDTSSRGPLSYLPQQVGGHHSDLG